jgi:glycosyltransferase involved in cell wall biosynthesis
LKAWGDFSDDILVIDDHSDDESVLACQSAGAEVVSSARTKAAWGNETPLRQQLWKEAIARTEPGDYIFVLDADMVPAKDPRHLIQPHTDAIAFPLYDLWAEYSDGQLMYRDDGYWQGHLYPRVWLVRRPEDQKWKWSGRGIHSGHFPTNLEISSPLFAPPDYGLLHYAYVNPALRVAKFRQYAKVAKQLSDFEKAHAQSIMDQEGRMSCLNFQPQYTLKCAS